MESYLLKEKRRGNCFQRAVGGSAHLLSQRSEGRGGNPEFEASLSCMVGPVEKGRESEVRDGGEEKEDWKAGRRRKGSLCKLV